ncbi:MAG: hypothetical protein GY950_16240 [bacterium]|nr:hypothetical protein [bacterium]
MSDVSEDIKVLNQKIDFLTEQVTGATSRLKAFDEFKEDLSLFANDAFGELVNFLADVDFHFRSEEFVFLVKKMLRNVKNISKMMDQLQSFTELVEDVSPLAKEVFDDVVGKFEQLEKDGMFKSLESAMSGIKRLHENFTPEEMERMGDNHVRLIKLTNRLGTPENLEKLENIADEIDQIDFKSTQKVSLIKIFKKARNPEVLRSMDLVLDIAAIISKQNNTKK